VQPKTAALDSSGKFLLVSNNGGSGNGSVSVFAINSSTGGLSEVANSPFPVTGNPVDVAVSKTSGYVYVATQNAAGPNSGGFYGFTVSSSTGALTAMAGSPYLVGVAPNFIAIAPNEALLCVLDASAGLVHAYDIASGTGVPTERTAGSPFTAGGQPAAAVFDPTSTYLFVADGVGTVEVITWSSLNVVSLAATQNSSTTPVYIALSPSGSALYVVNAGANTIYEFTVSTSTSSGVTTITVTPMSPNAVGTGATPSWIVTQ